MVNQKLPICNFFLSPYLEGAITAIIKCYDKGVKDIRAIFIGAREKKGLDKSVNF